jgi:hypothetical protein
MAPVREEEKARSREKTEEAPATTTRTDSSRGRMHVPWTFNRRHAKGS